MCLNHPDLKNDIAFKSGLGISYVKDNLFEELKEMEIKSKRVDFIGNMKTQLSVMSADMTEIPYFDLGWLIKKYGGFTPDDIKSNERYKERTKLKEEGYSNEDIEKIILGADKSKFKLEKPITQPDDPLAGLG
jgi:hypothetical protein